MKTSTKPISIEGLCLHWCKYLKRTTYDRIHRGSQTNYFYCSKYKVSLTEKYKIDLAIRPTYCRHVDLFTSQYFWNIWSDNSDFIQ